MRNILLRRNTGNAERSSEREITPKSNVNFLRVPTGGNIYANNKMVNKRNGFEQFDKEEIGEEESVIKIRDLAVMDRSKR